MSKSSKPILILSHSEHFPDNGITRDLAARGETLWWRRPYLGEALPAPDPEALGAIVIFGGPQFVTEIDAQPWMQAQVEWIGTFVQAGGRALGLCLGAQMIAHALGGRVWRYDDETSEIGFYSVEAVGNEGSDLLGDVNHFYQWHLEGFDLPEGSTALATNTTFPNQAFRWGERCYGFQFHPEMTCSMVERWTNYVTEHKNWMFDRPNAQRPAEHFAGWDVHAAKVMAWRSGFLDRWLVA